MCRAMTGLTLCGVLLIAGIEGALTATACPIGDFVWADTNGNGVQDAGEPGIPGVRVNLYRCGSTVRLNTMLTDANGNYRFSVGSPGDYYVEFIQPATGYVGFSPQYAQGPDPTFSNNNDSNVDPLTGKTDCVSVPVEGNLTLDAGLISQPPPKGSLGDFVWQDTNVNGVQDGAEPGVSGVVVNLYDCAGNFIATTTTDANGNYLFSNLYAGNYRIQFVLPSGYIFSLKNQGGDDALDSDADTGTGETHCITLPPGVTDLTWDAGLIKGEDFCPCVPISGFTGPIGTLFVWQDAKGVAKTYGALPKWQVH